MDTARAPERDQRRDPGSEPAAGVPLVSGPVERVLALQRRAGNAAVVRWLARVPKNPFDDPGSWSGAAKAAAAIDAYVVLAEADRRAFVKASYAKDLVRVLAALSRQDQVHKYRAAIMEICRWAEEEETRASAGMTDDQIASEQKDWMKQQAEAAAKAEAATKAPKGKPPPAPSAADIETQRRKQVEKTSIKPAGPIGWDALSAPAKKAWEDRGKKAVAKVVAHATANHPELKLKDTHFRVAFKDVEKRGATVVAFGESDGAGGTRAAVGYAFVTAVELDPAYVMDVVVHEIYGHPEYGTYGTEYHLKLYDAAMAKMPGYVKPAAGTQERTSEIDAYAYQETEMYSVLRSMPYRTAPKPAHAAKVPALDTQRIVEYRVGLLKQQWAPKLIVAILRGYRRRLILDPRISGAAMSVFYVAVDKHFDAATAAAVKK